MVFCKIKKIVVNLLVLVGSLAIPFFSCWAGSSDYGLGNTAAVAYGVDKPDKLQGDPVVIMGTILGIVLASLGVMFMIQIVIAGIKWMSAQGNEEKITKAKETLIHSVLGLVIIVGAYALVNSVLQGLLLSVFK
jgi:hypothetical protein